jgi:hypothetical protein
MPGLDGRILEKTAQNKPNIIAIFGINPTIFFQVLPKMILEHNVATRAV